MIRFESSGSTQRTEDALKRMRDLQIRGILEAYGQAGVDALSAATPADTGLASQSWTYEVTKNRGGWSISWDNTNVENGFPVAVMIQMGHGTGTGGYVPGRDYINPAMRPIFDQIANEAWKAVTSA